MPSNAVVFVLGMLIGAVIWHVVILVWKWYTEFKANKAHERAMSSGLLIIPRQQVVSLKPLARDTNDFLREFNSEVTRRESQRPPSNNDKS